jgi:hypothetical protein
MSIIRDGCCFICAKASAGLTGPAKDAALAEIKKKIEAGEIGPGHRRSSPPKTEQAHPEKGLKPRTARTGEPLPDVDRSAYPPGAVQLGEIPGPTEIPVTIRLMVEISVRVMGLTTAEAKA